MNDFRKHINMLESYLEEIETIDMTSDDNMKQLIVIRYNALKNEMHKAGSYQNLDVMFHKDDDGKMRFYVVDGKHPVGFMLFIEIHESSYDAYQVFSVWFEPAYRRKGLAAKLYDGLLKTGKAIISDSQQTKNAQDMWRSFLGKYKMFLVDNDENLHPIHTVEDMQKAYEPGSGYHSLLIKK